jgi:NADP-dependent 3-hydroxy acid dehydrogenase YdfG
MVNINLISPYYTLEFVPPVLRKQMNGHVTVISRVAGLKSSPGYVIYSATKFEVTAMIEGYHN